MMLALDTLLVLLGLPFLVAGLYLLAFTLLWRRPAPVRGGMGMWRFIVLVPAHNEEAGIAATVKSLRRVDYPVDRFRVVVVADNCTDRTADVAAAEGAQLLIRNDSGRRGKGYALQCAIARLLGNGAHGFSWNALVVVDADTVVERNLLHVMASHLEAGAPAAQAAYLPLGGGTSPVAVITRVAFTAFHLIRSTARERLGLSCGLRGNGMAFRRDLLATVPHSAFSKTEDLEFGVQLALRGVRIAFAGETRVYGEMPERAEAVDRQRDRWIGGRAAMTRKYVLPLVWGALTTPSLMLADVAMDLLVPQLSALVVASAAGLTASLALSAVAGVVLPPVTIWAVAFAALAIHVATAAVISGEGRAFLRATRAIPGYALDKTRKSLRAVKDTDDTWVRTPRKGEVL